MEIESQTAMQSMKFQNLLSKIGREIRPHDVEIFKNKLKVTERLPPSLLDDIDSRERNSGLEVLKKLKEEEYLAEDNLELLKELLLAIERHDLLQELSEFEKKVKTSSDVKGAVARETEAHQSISQRAASYISNLWRSITGRGRHTTTPRVTRAHSKRTSGTVYEEIHVPDHGSRPTTTSRPRKEAVYEVIDEPYRADKGTPSKRTSQTVYQDLMGPRSAVYQDLLGIRSAAAGSSSASSSPAAGSSSASSSPAFSKRTTATVYQDLLGIRSAVYEDLTGPLSIEFSSKKERRSHSLPSVISRRSSDESISSSAGSSTVYEVIDEPYRENKEKSKTVTIDVEGGFHDLSSFGVLLQVPPNAVTRPTVIRCRRISPDRIPLPTEENETLVSYCVEFESASFVQLQKPIIVTLAHSGPSKKEGYETIVKELRDSWREWKHIKEIREDSPLAREHFNSAYIRVEIMIKGCTALAVVTRPITDTFEVTDKGCVVRSSVCEDVTLEFPEGAVDKTYIGSLKLLLIPGHIDILDGMTAYPCPIILIDGFDGVNFTIPVKIKLPHPYPEGYPTGNVRVLTMDAPHEWQDISDHIAYVEDDSFIELQVQHFSGFWVWVYEAAIEKIRQLSRYLFTPPQAVCFGVYKEINAHSADSLKTTLICAPNQDQKELSKLLEDKNFTRLALATGDIPMRPNDKAYPWFKGSYQKGTTDEFFLQFLANDICRKELPLQRSSENDSESDSTLIIKFLASENDVTDCLCTLFVPLAKLFERDNPGETFSRRQGYLPSRPNDARPGPSDPYCQELVEYMASIDDLNIMDAETAAAKVSEKLQLDKYSMKDPPEDVVKKCRYLCLLIKKKERKDIVKEIRKKLPSGITGPLLDESALYDEMASSKKKEFTRALCDRDLWQGLADEFNIPRDQLKYYDRQKNPVEELLEEVCSTRELTIGELYDVLVKCGANALADKYL